jgi:hypothetical protein
MHGSLTVLLYLYPEWEEKYPLTSVRDENKQQHSMAFSHRTQEKFFFHIMLWVFLDMLLSIQDILFDI